MSDQSPLSVFVITTTWVPIAARVGVRLVEHGCTVSAICPRGHPLNHVNGIKVVHDFDPFDVTASLAAALMASSPTVIIPCDDDAVWLLHDLYQQRPELRTVIAASIGPRDLSPAGPGSTAAPLGNLDAYAITRGRIDFMRLARGLGVRVPDTVQVRNHTDIDNWSFDGEPVVMKRAGTCGGHGVKIVRSRAEAARAFGQLGRRVSPVVKWKRLVVDRDPLALWRRAAQRSPEVVLQRHVVGRPANTMLVCWRGEVLGSVTVEAVATQGETGASTIIRFIKNHEIDEASKRIAAGLSLSGFHGLDFVMEKASGVPFLIELNPRCTQLGHLNLPDQGDLVGLLCRRLGAPGAIRTEPPITESLVAFFPQATAWSPDSPYFAQCRQDIPWDEPALVSELLRAPWPERTWLMRLYRTLISRNPEPKPKLEKMNPSDYRAIQTLLAQSAQQIPRATLAR